MIVGLRRRRRAPTDDIEAALPAVVDLLALAVSSGCTGPAAVRLVAPRTTGATGVAMRLVVARCDAGERLIDALDALPARLGDAMLPLVDVLATALRDGGAIGDALQRLAADGRRARRARAHERARRLPVLLLFPLVCCILPAFVLLTVLPLLAGALGSVTA
jgi:pilus assembly protein TadC